MESQTDKLKQKYWEGTTSLEEEKTLKNMIRKKNASNLESAFFTEIAKRKSITSTPQFSIPKQKSNILWQLSSIAATIIIFIALAIGFNNYNNQNQHSINDPQEAYEISQQALMLVSTKLNMGRTYSSKIDKLNTVKQSINN